MNQETKNGIAYSMGIGSTIIPVYKPTAPFNDVSVAIDVVNKDFANYNRTELHKNILPLLNVLGTRK